jgi:PAS domain S-box-containing protein
MTKPKSRSSARELPPNSPLPAGLGASELTFLKVVVENVAQPIFVKDRGHQWVWCNSAFDALIGFPRSETLGKTDHDFFPAHQADFFHEKDREVFATGRVVVIEEEPMSDATGETHILATTKAPVFDAAGAVTHIVGIIHDITRRKHVEEALRLANQELEQRVFERTRDLREVQNALLRRERLVVLGQLAGGLAHQIRHPLSVISNAAAIIRQRVDVSKDPDLKRALFSMAEEVREADRIISDLIDFARVREATFMEISVGDLLDSVVANVHIPEPLKLEWNVARECLIRVDPRQTRDALGNLLRNAVESIESVRDQGKRNVIRFETDTPQDHFVSIRVIDSGAGVAPGMVSHLFEPLVTDKTLGLGLGLCTARTLIENQGGSLLYEPASDGACFVARLPCADGAASER